MSYEVLIAELLAYTHQEAFQVLELSLCLLNLGCHVDEVAQWYGKLVGAYHEAGCIGTLLGDDLNLVEVVHLQSYVVVSLEIVLAYYLERQLLLLGNVLLVANGTNTGDNLLHCLNVGCQLLLLSCRCRNLQLLAHDALAILAVVDVLPQLLRDEWHEWMQHLQEGIEEAEGSVVALLVDRLTVSWLHHLQVPR